MQGTIFLFVKVPLAVKPINIKLRFHIVPLKFLSSVIQYVTVCEVAEGYLVLLLALY